VGPSVIARASSTPAFGQADLSNCEREQIQFAASIQPHGALLVVCEPELLIMQASDNATSFLNLGDKVIGRSLEDLPGDLAARIRPHLGDPLHRIPRAVRCLVGQPAVEFDGLLHRPHDDGLIIELERAGSPVDLSRHVDRAVKTILTASSLRALCDATAKIFKDLTGYDRVMVYRFDDQGHGEVFSERRQPKLEAYLGNRYPASDIPQIARRLYERNRVRVLVDVGYTPVALRPGRLSPITGHDLDMSMCFLRSMSPIHIQYLQNMGVAATLVVSLMVGGKLWGLIACHHYVPRFAHFEVRAVCELLAEAIGTRIAALESFVQAQAELSVRRLEQRMIEAISREGDWKQALFDGSKSVLQHVGASGAALLFEDQVYTVGDVPGTQELRELGAWLDGKSQGHGGVVATSSLSVDEPRFSSLKSVASGVLSTTVSSSSGEHLVWFRPERIRTLTWGGDPLKPVIIGNNPTELSPRRSFAQWHQLVENTSEPWTPADLSVARLIGETVSDVVVQFRSVRMLIAQNQLEHASRQVEQAELPVIVSDSRGRILLSNDACEGLLPPNHPQLQWIDDLPAMFAESDGVRRRLRDLLTQRGPWRAEVRLEMPDGSTKPLLLRADPVFSTPEVILGFVILFTDLTERKTAEAARASFQENIIERHRVTSVRLDSSADLVFQNLLSSIVDNAQLAALEITDGVDLARMPEMLQSVHSSVTRAAEVLEQLIWHYSRISKKKP
jgi:two-component system, chemotaxis family, sensor kinase Cph1